MNDNKQKSIGGGWNKQQKNGDTYISCSLDIGGRKYNVSLFKNNFKQTANHPDWIILPQIAQGSPRTNQNSQGGMSTANNIKAVFGGSVLDDPWNDKKQPYESPYEEDSSIPF